MALTLVLAACSEGNDASNVTTPKLGFSPPETTATSIQTLRFADAEGKSLGLEAFRGKVVLLNVWATWCGPCREEMPTLDRLRAKLGGSEFEVLALSIDQTGFGTVNRFFKDSDLRHLRIYIDESGQATSSLNVVGIPTTLLLDRQGRELLRLVGPKTWDSPEMMQFIQQTIVRTKVQALSTMKTAPGATRAVLNG